MINRSLRLGTIQAHKINVEFSLDVFRFLFNGKGRRPDKGRGMLYGKEYFDKQYFGEDWWISHDKLGNGCCVDFPLRINVTVKFEPKSYVKHSNGRLVEKARSFCELLHVTVLKIRC